MEVIEFIEDGHLYLKNGILVASVSDILKFIFPDKYTGIPERILKEKAIWGSQIHKAIEDYETTGVYKLSPLQQVTFNQYLRVVEEHNIKPVILEEIISYNYDFCGRLDMIAEINGELCLIDIKTTAQLDHESLSWQTGMYKLACKRKIKKCFCLWLPKKDLGRLVEIQPKSKEEIDGILRQYHESNSK